MIRVAACLALILASLTHSAHAGIHTWIPAGSTTAVQSSSVQDGKVGSSGVPKGALSGATGVQIVEVTATRIVWGPGDFDKPINEVPDPRYFNSLSIAISSARERAVDLANACKNPLISAAAKSTTGGSGIEARWLAAQEMYNTIQASKLWTMYQGAYGGISIIVNGTSYKGFKVKYADGSTETWVVTPNSATSSVKLFDTPAPGSLQPGTPDC